MFTWKWQGADQLTYLLKKIFSGKTREYYKRKNLSNQNRWKISLNQINKSKSIALICKRMKTSTSSNFVGNPFFGKTTFFEVDGNLVKKGLSIINNQGKNVEIINGDGQIA